MTNDELLVNSYKEILEQIKENAAYLSKDGYAYTKELTDECADLTEEDYAFMYEMLNSYAENFIVDGRNPEKLKADTEIYEQLMEILSVLEENYIPQDYNCDEEE